MNDIWKYNDKYVISCLILVLSYGNAGDTENICKKIFDLWMKYGNINKDDHGK